MKLTDMINNPSAIVVQFKKSIFEEDFVERGMTAWFTKYEWDLKYECWKLYFDFTDFEDINAKYFTECYSGNYSAKYSVYYSLPDASETNVEAMLQSLEDEHLIVKNGPYTFEKEV